MKKLLLLLAATGMLAAGAGAQTQRVNRTNTRNKTAAPAEKLPEMPARNTDPATENSSGVNGIDGSINNAATPGMNRSSSLNYDYKANDVPATSVPAVATDSAAPAPKGRKK